MQPTKVSLSKNNGTLDKLWRSVGKSQAQCEVCVTLPPSERVNYTQLHPHHIIGRNSRLTRWDLNNRIWLCPTHHTMGNDSAHRNALWFSAWLQEHKPDQYNYLQEKQHKAVKWTLDDLLEIREELENAYE